MRPDQILDAAQRLLLAEGLDAMTMDAVADAAGVGKGTIYHYYQSKAELLSTLRARYLARTVARAEEAACRRAPRTALRRVERFIDALLESTVENGPLVWILFHQTAIEGEDELAVVHEAFLGLIRQGVDSGEFRITDPAFTAGFILHGFQGTVESAFHSGHIEPARLKSGMRKVIRSLLTP